MCVHAFVCVCVSEYYVIFVRRHIWPRGVQTQHDFNGLVVGGACNRQEEKMNERNNEHEHVRGMSFLCVCVWLSKSSELFSQSVV